jgi:hypothetical protein
MHFYARGFCFSSALHTTCTDDCYGLTLLDGSGVGGDPCKHGPPCQPGVGVFHDNKIFQPNKTVFAQVQCGIPDEAVLPLANFTATVSF